MGTRRTVVIDDGAVRDVMLTRLADVEAATAHNARLVEVIVEELQIMAWNRLRHAPACDCRNSDTAVRFLAGTIATQAERAPLVAAGGHR